MSLNEGVERLKRLVQKEQDALNTLLKEKEKAKKIYVNSRTSNFEREKIKLKFSTFLLPAIRRMENTIKSLKHQIEGIERGIQTIKKAQNRMTTLKENKPIKNHLTPAQRKELQNFEAELQEEFGPITQQNLINEARKMKAEENAIAEKILKNYHTTNSPELKKYYSKMLNALVYQSQFRMRTPEEEKELTNYLEKLKGGFLHSHSSRSKSIRSSRKSSRRMTRRRTNRS